MWQAVQHQLDSSALEPECLGFPIKVSEFPIKRVRTGRRSSRCRRFLLLSRRSGAGLAEEGGEVGGFVGDHAEFFGYDQGVVVDGEAGVADLGAHLVGVPEGLVA